MWKIAEIFTVFFGRPVMQATAGAVAGWIAGLFWEPTILSLATQLGITGLSVAQLGACLGFVGSYFKTVPPIKSLTPKKITL